MTKMPKMQKTPNLLHLLVEMTKWYTFLYSFTLKHIDQIFTNQFIFAFTLPNTSNV